MEPVNEKFMRCSLTTVRIGARFALIAVAALSFAQGTPIEQQLAFTPDHATGIYAIGETVGWTVTPGPEVNGGEFKPDASVAH